MRIFYQLAIVTAAWFVAGIMVGCTEAHASEHIRIVPCDGYRDYHQCAMIAIAGEIIPEDRDSFAQRTGNIQQATVVLSGPGGYLRSAINIGEIIHAKHWNTSVPSDAACLSACAYIWISGISHTVGYNSVLMWHSSYMGNNDQHADGRSNALLGMYMAHMGLTYDDVDWMVGNDPNDENVIATDEHGKIRLGHLRRTADGLIRKMDVQ